jgi:Domain of unknown function (DUF4483)
MRNPLLIKDEVGRAKPSIYNLPSSDFVYGFAKEKDPEGAKEVTMKWVYADPKASPRTETVTDFQKLNKLVASKGRDAMRSIDDMRKRCVVISSPVLKIAPIDDPSKH